MIRLQKMVDDQFIVAAVTGVTAGQNKNTHNGNRNDTDATLIARPYLPSDQRRGGSGGPESRLQIRQLMVTRYEVRSATKPSDARSLRAMEDPMLMHASNELKTTEAQTAPTGVSHLIDTYGHVSSRP